MSPNVLIYTYKLTWLRFHRQDNTGGKEVKNRDEGNSERGSQPEV